MGKLLPAAKTQLAESLTRPMTQEGFLEQLAAFMTGYTPDKQGEQQEATYYDYPVLKTPIWR